MQHNTSENIEKKRHLLAQDYVNRLLGDLLAVDDTDFTPLDVQDEALPHEQPGCCRDGAPAPSASTKGNFECNPAADGIGMPSLQRGESRGASKQRGQSRGTPRPYNVKETEG